MQGRALAQSAKQYLLFLVRAALFPLIWLWALAIARRHDDTDPKGRAKVLTGAAAGLVLAVLGAALLLGFTASAQAQMYDQLDTRMAVASGESEYQDHVAQIGAKEVQIGVLSARLQQAEETGNEANATTFRASLQSARAEHAMHTLKVERLQRNHDFYQRLSPVIQAQDDAQAKQMIDAFAAETDPAMYEHASFKPAISFSAQSMEKQADRAFGIKDRAAADMTTWMVWLLLPGLIGVLFAPLVLAVGSVLRNAWEPSDTVGYKTYPSGAMAWLLLLGAFGVPALFFAAWSFWDMDVRSTEGQISL